jgi:hypothetical protein
VAAGIAGFAEYRYEIIGIASNKCQVKQSFTANPDPELIGKEMVCLFDRTKTMEQNVKAMTDSDLADCSGPLVALMGGQ